jgi:peroxiredoxin
MKLNYKLLIIAPAAVSILLSFFIFMNFWEKRKFNSYMKDAVTFADVPLPASNLTSIEGDFRSFNSDIVNGKVLLIFISTSCSACKKEVKIINESLSKLKPTIKVFGVTIEDKTEARRYADANKLGFPMLFDTGGRLFEALTVRYFPTKVLVENGTITKTWIGSSPDQQTFFKDIGYEEK